MGIKRYSAWEEVAQDAQVCFVLNSSPMLEMTTIHCWMAVMVRGVLTMVDSREVTAVALSEGFAERLQATLLKSSAKGASDEVLAFQLTELCADLKPEQLPAFRAELMANVWSKLARMPVMGRILEGFTWTCRIKTDVFNPAWRLAPPPTTYQDAVQMTLLGGILDVSSDAKKCFHFFVGEYQATIFGKSGESVFSASVQNPALRKALIELFRRHVFALAEKGERESIHLFTWVRGGIAVRSGREQDDIDKALVQAAISSLNLKKVADLLGAGLTIQTEDAERDVSIALRSIREAENLCLRFVVRLLPEVEYMRNPQKTPFGEHGGFRPVLEKWTLDTRSAVMGVPGVMLYVSTALSEKILGEIRAIKEEICAQADKGKFIGSRKTEIDVTIIVPIDGRPQEIKL